MALLTATMYNQYINDLRDRLESKTQAELESMHDTAALEEEERSTMLRLNERCRSLGVVDDETCDLIFKAIGESYPHNGGWADGTDLATKITITKLAVELLSLALVR